MVTYTVSWVIQCKCEFIRRSKNKSLGAEVWVVELGKVALCRVGLGIVTLVGLGLGVGLGL